MNERIEEKLKVLADAAKYDVSCSSSGSKRPNHNLGLGDASNVGICHSYTEDGRCVSLLKVLFTNHCIFDCAYCVSRRSNDVRRVAFKVQEVVDLTINFYRRNYIEGLFLSSGIFKDADYTMERLVRIVKKLRTEHRFNGYIHLKAIPGASDELIHEAGMYADRLSVNLELPTEIGLKLLAPEKSHKDVIKPMSFLRDKIVEYKGDKGLIKYNSQFAPAGQSTQMVIGATPENDKEIMYTADHYYKKYQLKRVYYSGYVPISKDLRLPSIGSSPPLIRENRLYQADWLLRYYKFDVSEILNDEHPLLDLEIDPKFSWALRNPQLFPLDINKAEYEMILRVPGIGVGSAKKIINARKFGALNFEQLKKLGVACNRAKFFIICRDKHNVIDYAPEQIKHFVLAESKSKYLKSVPNQLNLFS